MGRARGSLAALLVIALALAGVLAGFVVSLRAASRAFEHAVIAEQQAAAVTAIARQAGHDGAALAEWVADYRDLVRRESDVLPQGSSVPREEMARADTVAALTSHPGERGQLAALLGDMARGERAEVAQARAEMAATRRRMLVLGGLLAGVALAAAGLGGWSLLRANRDLAGQVAARTEDLLAVDRSRRLFFAKASHELRTPVTALRSVAEVALASMGADGGDARAVLGDVVAQAQFLGHRIDEMLALASAEEGKPVLALVPCDLRAVMAGVAAAAEAYARSVEVEIACEGPQGAVMVMADARWLGQAVLAVVENGLKFSDPGGRLRMELQVAGGEAVIGVTDAGPGILPAELPRIFDAYYQAEAGRERGGTGLGLALARWVAEQHGGWIRAENLAGGGCRVVLGLEVMA